MSWWTDVLLTASALEDIGTSEKPDQYVAVDYVNDWLRENSYGFQLAKITHPTGTAPNSCFAGSFKSLWHDEFIKTVRSAPWQWREQIQLFLRQEDDMGFQEIKLWEANPVK